MSTENSAHVREMQTKMIGNRTLRVPIFLNSLGYFLVPLPFVSKYTLFEYFFKVRSIGKPLALGYLGNVLMPSEVINEVVNKIVFAEDGLALNLCPDGLFVDPPFYKLAILFLRLSSRSAELAEYPLCGEAGVRLFFACCSPIAGPRPVLGSFYHSGAKGIKNHVTADLQKMRVFLDENGFVPALEEMSCFIVAFVSRLCINAV